MAGPLEGIHIFDISQAAAGPWAASLLAEMGAEVIKAEPPPGGDFVRHVPPYKTEEATGYMAFSRSKRGIVLDLKKNRDREIAYKLVKWADVFVENFRPGAVERMGLGYDTLSKLNPWLIYCSISGFGQTGPLAQHSSVDNIAQAMSGTANISGSPGGRGERARLIVSDMYTALFACQAILMALYAREQTGRGQKIETSQQEATIALQAIRATEYLATGQNPRPMGTACPSIVPSQAFRTKDSYIVVDIPTERFWVKLCRALGQEDLATHPKFASNGKRVEHRDELVPHLEEIFLQKPTAEWLRVLEEHDVPCGPIYRSYLELYADPQIVANRLVIEMGHPYGFKVKTPALPWSFSQTPGTIKRLAPLFGQHQDEVLAEFGYASPEGTG